MRASLLLLSSLALVADDKPLQPKPIREHYTKYEYLIPMRDGVKLFTAVYVPKDQSQAYPILLTRTPYSVGPYGVGPVPRDARAHRPLRARTATSSSTRTCAAATMSEGKFVNVRPHKPARRRRSDIDESTDT